MRRFSFLISALVFSLYLPNNLAWAGGGLSKASSSYSPSLVLRLFTAQSGDPVRQPKNWRSSDEVSNSLGLESLNCSGSGQFSKGELTFLIQEKFRNKKVTVIDLRQESHAFLNGNAVAWIGIYDEANRDKALNEIEQEEVKKIHKLKSQDRVDVYWVLDKKEKPDPSSWKTEKISMTPISVQTEKELLEEMDVGYFRIAGPDYKRPKDTDVDRFVSFVKTLPENRWLHFHCAAGMGRTTTFMAMYDIMRNFSRAGIADIVNRQRDLGGIDLIGKAKKANKNRNDWAVERGLFIQKFYKYSQEEGPNSFETPWSEWSKKPVGR